MSAFLETISSYPTSIYTVLLGVVLVYWLIVLLGLIDIDVFDGDLDPVELDLEADVDGASLTGVAAFLLSFGLTGVPLSVVVSIVALSAWFICGLVAQYLLPWVPTEILRIVAGTVLLVAAFFVALPVAARVIRPLKKIFVTHQARHNADILGSRCRITTLSVSEDFGQAFVETGGAGLTVQVRATQPNALTKNSVTTIIDYSPETGTYRVAVDSDQ